MNKFSLTINIMLRSVFVFCFFSSCSHLGGRLQKNSEDAPHGDSPSTADAPPRIGDRPDHPDGTGAPLPPDGGAEAPLTSPTIAKTPIQPKVGIILGPGGAHTYAHVGFLRQIQKQRWNLQAIAGIEMAAPIAALYAHKEQVNEVEWQLFKLKDQEIFDNKPHQGKQISFKEYADFLKDNLQDWNTKDFKIAFACPALNLATGREFLMSRGAVPNLVELCSPYPPLFFPYKRNIAAMRSLRMIADYLRKQGANFIVLVNVVPDRQRLQLLKKHPDSIEQILWSEISLYYAKPQGGIDAVVNLELPQWDLYDFSAKRDLIQAGERLSERSVESLSRRLGF